MGGGAGGRGGQTSQTKYFRFWFSAICCWNWCCTSDCKVKKKRKFGERIKSMKNNADMVNKKQSLAAYVQKNLIRSSKYCEFCLDRMLTLGMRAKMCKAAESSKKESEITVKASKVFWVRRANAPRHLFCADRMRCLTN